MAAGGGQLAQPWREGRSMGRAAAPACGGTWEPVGTLWALLHLNGIQSPGRSTTSRWAPAWVPSPIVSGKG